MPVAQLGGAVTRLRREPRDRSPPRGTTAELLKRLGRALLWCLVAVLLLRGAADLMAVEEPAPVTREVKAPAPAWPDDEARAFAQDFARAYLTWPPRGLERFVAPELQSSILPELRDRGREQTVEDITVARTAGAGERRALITVAATLASGTRYLAVPVAHHRRGGLG